MFHATFQTLTEQEFQQVVCDLPDQMGGFGGQKSIKGNSLHPVYHLSSDNFLMYSRTSRRNDCCSDQRSFHQLLKVVGKNDLRVAGDNEKRTSWWNQEVKEAI